jgi:hypothetical protein
MKTFITFLLESIHLFNLSNKIVPTIPKITINPDHGRTIARAYETMRHDPDHPEVQAAYHALINETGQQYRALLHSGLRVTKITPGMENPYPTSKHLHADLDRGHMFYYPTESGFGSGGADQSRHPMLRETEFRDSEGKPLAANDQFRIVHDTMHWRLRNGFGPRGEHEAYELHKTTFSSLAQKALATETMGQNSVVNFGTNAAHNRAKPSETIYADQVAGLLPDHIINGRWHQ